MKVTKAVIPVAGLGTRLLPVTKSQPKEMLPLGRKPCVQHIVEEIASSGLTDVLFITGANKRSIEDHFDLDHRLRSRLREAGRVDLLEDLKFEDMDLDFYYTRQKTQAGLGDAVRYAAGFTEGSPFVVALGDAVIATGDGRSPVLERMLDLYDAHRPAFVVAVRKVPKEDVSKYGIVDLLPGEESDGSFWIRELIEKPARHEAPSNYAIAARYIFSNEIFEFLERTLPGAGGEIQLTDAMQMMLKHGHQALAVPLGNDEVRHDVGTFESYFRSFIDFALRDKEYGYRVRQHIQSVVEEID